MKMYEDTKFSQWQKKSVSTITSALKKNVLKVVERKTVTGMYKYSEIRKYDSIKNWMNAAKCRAYSLC
jgi:hypothetical protein